jgi:hypothetical protein
VSKYLKIIVAALMAVAMAAPAFADSKISGYFRNQFMVDNIQDGRTQEKDAASQIDQRLRVKYQNNLNEYVFFVYYGEVDTKWGQPSAKAGGGGGGMAGADATNVETKNAYLDVTIPDSIWAIRTGIQGYGIGPDGIVEGNDLAGLQITHVLAPNVNVVTAYFKPYENDTMTWDDQDIWSVKGNFKLTDMAKVNVDATYLDLNSLAPTVTTINAANGFFKNFQTAAGDYEDADIYIIDAGGNFDLGMAKLDLFAAYSGGTINAASGSPASDFDVNGFMATGKVKADLGPAKAALRLTYYSSDDDLNDDDAAIFIGDLTGGAYEFYNENLSIFFTDKYYNSTAGGRLALTDAAYSGAGLLAVNATADFVLPANSYLKTGAGYFTAIEDQVSAPAGLGLDREGKDLGFEVAARLGTKVAEKVDCSLGGAYAVLGDFYKDAGVSSDPDDIYKVNFVVNVGF